MGVGNTFMKHLCKPSRQRRWTSLLWGTAVSLAVLIGSGETSLLAQDNGQISGVVKNASGAAVAGVTVLATNQVTSKVKRARTGSDGSYSIKLSAGAYRLSVAAPHSAKFEKTKDYGPWIMARDEVLENVVVEPGKTIAIDIVLDEKKPPELQPGPADEPIGYAGKDSVPSDAQTIADRRAVRDRWRIGFPEYDRYGDKGARGRDIPFKKGRWWDPYNQSVLKGDYPIKGNELFLVLSGVSTTTVQQVRAPTPSNVGTDEPSSAEFFGQPEQLAASHLLQLTFELFHGQTTFRPRSWAIKISPTFSIPNYVNARENGVVNIDVRRGTNRTDSHFSLEEAFAEVKLRGCERELRLRLGTRGNSTIRFGLPRLSVL